MADGTAIEIEGSEVAGAIARSHGLPRLRWDEVHWWIQANVPEDRARDAWISVQMQWLGLLSFALGSHYHVFQSPRALLLGAMNRAFGRYASGRIERALTTLDYVLPGIVQESSRGKHVVICLAGEDEIDRYMAEYPEASDNWDGVCLRREDVHVVIKCAEAIPELLLVHELTHACLTHLQLPRWLDEAMSQRMERIEGRIAYTPLTDEYRRLWRAHDFAAFLDGSSFRGEREVVAASYGLAENLLQQICLSKTTQLAQFIRNASIEDGGNAAAVEHLGHDLEYYLERLLKAPPLGRAERVWRKLTGRG